jgi:hypothetical protein
MAELHSGTDVLRKCDAGTSFDGHVIVIVNPAKVIKTPCRPPLEYPDANGVDTELIDVVGTHEFIAGVRLGCAIPPPARFERFQVGPRFLARTGKPAGPPLESDQ